MLLTLIKLLVVIKTFVLSILSGIFTQVLLYCQFKDIPGSVAQSVTCLATDASLTANPGVASLILARSHTFVEIDHEIISMFILLISTDSFQEELSVTSESMCTKYWLTACSSLPWKKCG